MESETRPHTEPAATPGESRLPVAPVRLLRPSELFARPIPRDLVSGLLPEKGLFVLYGRPDTAKTFAALDLGLCIASGTPWHGRAVVAGDVIYLAGEGLDRLQLRILTWLHGRKVSREFVDERFRLAADPLEFLDSSFTRELAYLVALRRQVRLVVIDTLARCFVPCDENSTADMSRVVARCDELRRHLDSAVLIVHHTAKAGGEERGSGALRAAADTMLRAERQGAVIKLTCDKQKDAALPASLSLRLETVQLDPAADGTAQSSCRLVRTEPTAGRRGMASIGQANRLRLAEALRDADAGNGVSSARLIAATGLARSTLLAAMKYLVSAGCAARRGNGKAVRYRFVRMPEPGETSRASS